MNRLAIFTFLLTRLLVAASSGQSDLPPKLTVALYAPLQKNIPVNIVGIEHDSSDIQFLVLNSSEKSVSSIIISRVNIAPLGCAVDQPGVGRDLGVRSGSGGRFLVPILPHGRALVPGKEVHYPKTTVYSARRAGAAYMQSQFGVTGVFFDDGTTWPVPIDLHYRVDPFDPSLVEAEAGKCTDVAVVAKALESVQEVVFDRQIPAVPSKSDDAVAVPHLRFSCSLEGPKAVCRLPLESNLSAPHPQPEASER
jgi:hypothetical protein